MSDDNEKKLDAQVKNLETINASLARELSEIQELLVRLLTESTELVSKGGVATYKMKLGVGDFVDLCRATGVEL